MLSVVVLILKIIGWTLLGLLGILLLVLAAVLFGAIRYRAEGRLSEGKFQGRLKVSWLFPLFSFDGIWKEDGISGSARVIGIRIWTTDKEPSPSEESPEDDPVLEIQEIPKSMEREAERELKKNTEPASAPDPSAARQADGFGASKAGHGSRKEKAKKTFSSPFSRQKLQEAIRKIRFSFRRIYGKLKEALKNFEAAKAWFSNEANKKSAKLVWAQAKKAVRHLLPKKVKGSLTFGLDDPFLTGSVLKYAALFYPLYGEQVEIYPVFDKKILEAEGQAKGRIRIGCLAGRVLRLLLDKNIRGWILDWLKR